MSSNPITYPPLSFSIAVREAARAMDFYKTAFGAVERYRLVDPESGKIGHAEMTIGGCLFMLAEEYPEYNRSPETLGGTAVRLCLMVDDADAALDRAVKAGATILRPAATQFYGHRSGSVRDPFGHEWILSAEVEKVSPEEMQRRWDSMGESSSGT